MNITPMKTNFTAGELSPRVYGRSDIDRYRNGAEALENMFVLVQGGTVRRYGLRYTQPAKHAHRHSILVPYVFNREQAYMLEFGDAYIRVYLQNGAQVLDDSDQPYEIATGYFETDLDAIDYVQSGDTMLLFHEKYPTRRLRRFGNAAWVIEDVPWVNVPAAEVGERPAFNATLDSLVLGPGRTLTAGGASFMPSDVGREIECGGGLALVTAYSSTTVVTVDVQTPFASVFLPVGTWVITGSPYATLTPSWSGGTGNEQPAVGEVIELTLGIGGWRADDVGKLVEVNGGLIQITTVTSATVASGELRKTMSSLVAAPALAWVLMGDAWSAESGYPRTGTFFEQRLWCAGSRQFPRTIWGSKIGEYLDFELGTDADSAISIFAASEQQDAITHLTNLGDALVALSGGGIVTVRGTDDSAIAANSKNKVMTQPNFGCNTVSPERVGTELMYVQRGNKKIRALSADRVNTDQYLAPDITVLAEHMVKPGITRLAFQDEPDPLLFALIADGTMCTGTIDRDQDVIGWTPQRTDGQFDAVAALPTEEGMQVWVIVKRMIDGDLVRYIERFDPGAFTDSAIYGNSPGGATLWGGLNHLEGKTVKVKADGVALNDRVVVDGHITIERPAIDIEIGLGYLPRVKLLRPEVGGDTGTSQNSNISVSDITLRVLQSTGLVVNGQVMFARKTGIGVLDQPPPLLTGDERIENLGWELGDFHCEITQPMPYPFHLQAVILTMTVNK